MDLIFKRKPLLFNNFFFFCTNIQATFFCDCVTCRNEAVVISGRKLAQQIKQEVQQEVEEWVASGNKRPHLSVILVGDNPASHSYVLNKTRAAAEVGKCCHQSPPGVCHHASF